MNLAPLVIAVVLLVLNGFFVAAEFALIAARRSRIEQLAEEGNARAKVLLRSVKELSLMLAGAQLGITMASLGLGAIAEPAVAHLLEGPIHALGAPEAATHSIAFVIALAIVVFFHMVIGEMAPKNFAISEPERSALWIAVPFRVYVMIFRPFIHLLNLMANGTLRALNVEPKDELESIHTSGEIGLMIAESARGGMIDDFEHKLLEGAIAFGERDAASVMVPRPDIVAAPLDVTPAALERMVIDTGHSRIPLFTEDLDHVVGFVHVKDLLAVDPRGFDKVLPRRLVRQMMVVPETLKLHPLMLDMRRRRQHFALVIDEHGGTAGIVTLEDLLEELVGDIRDEYDMAERGVVTLGPGRWCIPGTLRIDEAESAVGLELPEGEYETVAGFLMDRLGRIPRRRDSVEVDGWLLRVNAMHRRRVEQVIVERGSGAS